MDPYSRRRHKHKHRRSLIFALIASAIVASLFAWFVTRSSKPVVSSKKTDTTVSTNQQQKTKETPKPALIDLQPVVDDWVSKQTGGEYGIVVYDPANKKIIATHDADTQFFTASIYKIYTVYLAWQDVDAGKQSLDENFLGSKTRKTCLFDAIHTSDSPCAEALLNEIGQPTVNDRLKKFGFTGTNFPGFVTSAGDSIRILQRIYDRDELKDSSTDQILEAMKTQVYRDGLPKGMAGATVADKVGFSETPHYHDVAIVTLPNDRVYLVAFLSKGVGSKVVANFGSTIYDALNK